ncbi:retrotransposon ORF1 [Tanacetum coccineum]
MVFHRIASVFIDPCGCGVRESDGFGGTWGGQRGGKGQDVGFMSLAGNVVEDVKGGIPSNLKIPCNIGHVHVGKAYIDLNSLINIMTRMQYNWIMRKQLEPREDPESLRGISNFTGRVKGMHIFVGNFTYVLDFAIVEDIISAIDPRSSQVVLGKPFVELSNMTHDLSLGIVKFTNGTDEIAYNIPHKIEQYDSLSDMEKEDTQSVYIRNEEDIRKGVDYVMNKI